MKLENEEAYVSLSRLRSEGDKSAAESDHTEDRSVGGSETTCTPGLTGWTRSQSGNSQSAVSAHTDASGSAITCATGVTGTGTGVTVSSTDLSQSSGAFASTSFGLPPPRAAPTESRFRAQQHQPPAVPGRPIMSLPRNTNTPRSLGRPHQLHGPDSTGPGAQPSKEAASYEESDML